MLIINGKPVDDTDNVISTLGDPYRSWNNGDHGTDIVLPAEQIVGHWTAAENQGDRVARNMKARKNKAGKPLRVGVHFIIGTPTTPGEMAPIWQCADPGNTRCVHVGSRVVNRRSVGVEIVNSADKRLRWAVPDKRGLEKVTQLGVQREWTKFYPEQLDAWVWLCDVLTYELGIERNTFRGDRRMMWKDLKDYKGVLEHWNVGGTRKMDAGGMLTSALVGEGYIEVGKDD